MTPRRGADDHKWACDGKHRFASFDQAQRLGIRGENRHRREMRPYHCKSCGGFHVGSTWVSTGKFNRKKKIAMEAT